MRKDLDNKIFSKIPNTLLVAEDKSILELVGDNKIILILHKLQTLSTLENKNICYISIEYLVKNCGYKIDKDTNKSFKNILLKLKELELINFNDFRTNKELIEIDITKLKELDKFIQLYPEEIETIQANSKDKREFLNLLKVYLLLKKAVHKRNKEKAQDVNVKHGGEIAETTYLSHDYISLKCNINKRNIKKYIDRLQDLKLIKYANLGTKYKANSKNKLISECTNLYALTYISSENGIDTELEYGLSLQKAQLEDAGYTIVQNNKKKKNDNGNKLTKQQKGGKISAIKRKIKNGTATDRDLEELKELQGVDNDTIKDINEDDTLKQDIAGKENIQEIGQTKQGNKEHYDPFGIKEKLEEHDKKINLTKDLNPHHEQVENWDSFINDLTKRKVEDIF